MFVSNLDLFGGMVFNRSSVVRIQFLFADTNSSLSEEAQNVTHRHRLSDSVCLARF